MFHIEITYLPNILLFTFQWTDYYRDVYFAHWFYESTMRPGRFERASILPHHKSRTIVASLCGAYNKVLFLHGINVFSEYSSPFLTFRCIRVYARLSASLITSGTREQVIMEHERVKLRTAWETTCMQLILYCYASYRLVPNYLLFRSETRWIC